ncbi:copper chaperone PCu(A)C [Colwellia sp. KU-HH00111]|uniref:copper chaperone PCu(A)C n=1 Tax=Colwellia sp. KU-HH00111 TaxID=3127652 RepID=UPI0031030E38
MSKCYLLSLVVLCQLLCFAATAQPLSSQKNSMIVIEKPYVRATIPGTSIASSYMEIVNNSDKTVTLLSASSNISPRVELHQHTMVDGMMRMRKVNSIDIKSKGRIKLQPSGLHLMLFDIKTPLVSPAKVELMLNFSTNQLVTVNVPIYSPAEEKAANQASSTMHEHHH